jgi:hypothetical protein
MSVHISNSPTKRTPGSLDVNVGNHGSIVFVHHHTPDASHWVDSHQADIGADALEIPR